MSTLPETILQFGSGKFLRGFADLFIHQANQEGQQVGRIVVVQTTGDQRANLLSEQDGRYHVWVRGLSGGQIVDRVDASESISRALFAGRQWDEILAVARSPQLHTILSNTAEAGYDLDAKDRPESRPPNSFPAKLLLVLRARFEAQQPGVTVLPCELFEHNADRLLGIVLQLATDWGLAEALRVWMQSECVWRNCLVDRIVTNPSPDTPLAKEDRLLVVGEPYALWAIEMKDPRYGIFQHPAIRTAPDINPFFLRKVRILNAAHTALVSRAVPKGIPTVLKAMEDTEVSDWLQRLLFEEVVPTVADRVEDADGFAHQTLERFRNPFLEHKLSDIMVYHDAKVKIRLQPTCDEFEKKLGRKPEKLEQAIAWSPPSS